MKTTSHNKNPKPDKSYFGEADELITVHKSSITQASMQMANLMNADVINHMFMMQNLQQMTGIQQPCIPPMNFGYAASVADRVLEIEKQRFGDNKRN